MKVRNPRRRDWSSSVNRSANVASNSIGSTINSFKRSISTSQPLKTMILAFFDESDGQSIER